MAYTPRTLVIGDFPLVRELGTLLSGQNLDEGAVLGAILCGAATASAISGTGNATIGPITNKPKIQVGVYTILFIAATKFEVYAPDGKFVGFGTTGVAFSNQIGFTITAGGVACVPGDNFTVTVAAGSGKLTLVNSTATDGSDVPVGVLPQPTDATAGDFPATYFVTGIFSEAVLTFGGTDTITTHRAALRKLQIYARPVAS
jgi:head decoration protein D